VAAAAGAAAAAVLVVALQEVAQLVSRLPLVKATMADKV
jgi:hypothetical protein